MSQPLHHLQAIANSIGNLTSNDLERLGRILVRDTPLEACDLLDGIRGEFSLIEKELEL